MNYFDNDFVMYLQLLLRLVSKELDSTKSHPISTVEFKEHWATVVCCEQEEEEEEEEELLVKFCLMNHTEQQQFLVWRIYLRILYLHTQTHTYSPSLSFPFLFPLDLFPIVAKFNLNTQPAH